MRRNSPTRYMRRNSPRRGGDLRALSPLSRSQPAPPGEERRRKSAIWDDQIPHKRPRSRSRSRERIVLRDERERLGGRINREPPVMRINDEDRSRFVRGGEPLRDGRNSLRKEDRPRERSRERQREHSPRRGGENRVRKPKLSHKRHSFEHDNGFEENYLDLMKHRDPSLNTNHEEPILDPSSITFNTYPEEHSRENPRDKLSLKHSGQSVSFSKHDKVEKAEDRINRLEKMVEKLVEGNNTTKMNDLINPLSKDGIPELIPSNDKFTTSMWINRIHDECLDRKFDEKTSIRFMQDKMTGIIKSWFKTVSSYDFTWPELKLLITQTFPDNVEFAKTLKLLVSRDKTPDETITQYYFSKLYLCEACKITGENAVSCLIDGLNNPFMKQEIKSYGFLAPEALYSEFLSKYPEQDYPVRMEHREIHVDHRQELDIPVQDFIPFEVESRDRNYHIESHPSSVREHFGKRLAEAPKNKKKEKPRCFTCKKLGHRTVDCRHAPICYNCKKKGHIAAKCTIGKVMYISTSNKNISQNIFVVKCGVKGKDFNAFIDTGATSVTMKECVAKYLQLELKHTNEVLEGYGGSLVQPLGETWVDVQIASTQRLVKVLIVSDKIQKYPLIIGQEFLLKKGVSTLIQNSQLQIIDLMIGAV